MINFKSKDQVMTLTAPSGGVVSGVPKRIGTILVVPTGDAAEGDAFQGLVIGVVDLPKAASEVWTANEKLYFDVSAGVVTSDDDTGTNKAVGVAVAPFVAADVDLDFIDALGSGGLTIDGLEITIVDYADLSGATLNVTVGGVETALLEEDSGAWEAMTGNNETADSLAAAIDAIDGVSAAAVGAVITVTPGTGITAQLPGTGRVRLDGVARP